jgi:hypothetical protein
MQDKEEKIWHDRLWNAFWPLPGLLLSLFPTQTQTIVNWFSIDHIWTEHPRSPMRPARK